MADVNSARSGTMSRRDIIRSLTALVLLFAVASCTGAREAERTTPRTGALSPGDVSPGEALVVGTILRVDAFRAERSTDPCARNPCYAMVQIDTVMAYGPGFPRPLSAGERLHARFAFTLAPTEEILPELTAQFPGMDAGDTFQAILRVAVVPITGSADPLFVIFDYHPI